MFFIFLIQKISFSYIFKKYKYVTTCSSSVLELSSGIVSGNIVSFGEGGQGSSSVLACLEGASDCDTDTFWLGGLTLILSSLENFPEKITIGIVIYVVQLELAIRL